MQNLGLQFTEDSVREERLFFGVAYGEGTRVASGELKAKGCVFLNRGTELV